MSKAENSHALSIANRRLKAVPRQYPLCPAYDIETAYGLIKAFGGFEATAAEYGIATEQVERWAVSGFISTGWHLRMFGRVCAMGKTIAPSVWGFSEDDEAGQAIAHLMYDARLAREGGANV